jgi:uncharacterized glyoxalase superfamily protein PhnB
MEGYERFGGGEMTDGTPPAQVWHSLLARDARGLIKFLEDGFGFEAVMVIGEGDRVDHAQLAWPLGGGIFLGSVREGNVDVAPIPGGSAAYVVTDEPDALFQRAKDAGARILIELHDSPHGSRDFSVLDPEGNRWSFGTYRGEPVT